MGLSWPTAVQVELDQLEGPVADQHGLPARVGGVEGHLNTKIEVHPYRREGQQSVSLSPHADFGCGARPLTRHEDSIWTRELSIQNAPQLVTHLERPREELDRGRAGYQTRRHSTSV